MNERTTKASEVQGEGDKEAARNYEKATREFVESGKVEKAEEKAGEQGRAEAEQAEREGLDHAKEEDPAVRRDYQKPAAE